MKKTFIETIKNRKTAYLVQVEHSREKLAKELDNMTSQQIMSETIYISDMESRAYALTLLLEELEVE